MSAAATSESKTANAPEQKEQKSASPDGEIKTIVEVTTNSKGQKVRLIKKVRVKRIVRKINKRVEARRRWRKFGDCAGLPPGPERGITSIAEEVTLDLTRSRGTEKEKEKEKTDQILSSIVCRHCGKVGDHWTLKCPFKNIMPPLAAAAAGTAGAASPVGVGAAAAGAGGSEGRYQPPGLRGAPSRWTEVGPGAGVPERRRDEATVRVTNLSEDTKESDLQDLFRPFGPINRIYLAKDKHTGLSKGFAFISFIRREDAQRAIDKLDGYGYDNLILHLEWARPST